MKTRSLACALGIAAACLPPLGCGEEDDPFVPPVGADASTEPDAPTPDAAPPPDAEPLADVPVDVLGPSNVRVDVPADGAIVIGEDVAVQCHAEPNATTMSPVVSVKFEVTDETNGTPIEAAGSAIGNDDYTATVDASTLRNGLLRVRCIAQAADERKAGDQNDAFIDLGPTITAITPTNGGFAHAQVVVDFTVEPEPIQSPDPDAAVANVRAALGGIEVPLAQNGDHYTASVLTNDPMFPSPLTGATQLEIVATNERGATRELVVTFTVDDTGPDITIVEPAAPMIGGLIYVEASVTDALTGVDPTSVSAVFGNGTIEVAEFDLTPTGQPNRFAGYYDSRALRAAVEVILGPDVQLVYPTLSVRARDLAGAEGNVGHIYILDYTPPLASLDPPMLREAKEDNLHGGIDCAREFDPVGDDAVNDLQEVAQIFEMRARIEDRGNTGLSTSSTVDLAAGVNESTAQILILDETNPLAGIAGDALLVDTDGDGVCDDVNPMLMPGTPPQNGQAVAINLVAITPAGDAFYQAEDLPAGCDPMLDPGCEEDPYLPEYPECDPPTEIALPPPRLCLSTGLQRAMSGPLDPADPVLYGPSQTIEDVYCLGLPVDAVANNLEDGWVCAAVRVEDNLGNVGISQPIRICIDHDDDDLDGCPGDPWYPSAVDQNNDETDVPIIPYASPASVADCLGVWTPPTGPGDPDGTTDSATACEIPDDFFEFPLQGEIRVRAD